MAGHAPRVASRRSDCCLGVASLLNPFISGQAVVPRTASGSARPGPVVKIMSKAPQFPHSGNPAPRPGGPSSWVDLIAFLGILTLGGILMGLGRTTAGSLVTICAALGSLYGVWKHVGYSRGSSSNSDETPGKRDEPPD